LNEGVDVPAAKIAIILSGTGSAREYTQRLGRVLRKGQDANKQAILYEVIAEDTSEEGTSVRRRGFRDNEPQRTQREENQEEDKRGNLRIVYGTNQQKTQRAAEQLGLWNDNLANSEDSDDNPKF
jgi:superfamily II DNA or RNA helicase